MPLEICGGVSLTYPGRQTPVITAEETVSFAGPGLTLLLGLNGQGKTTLMRYLCGLLPGQPLEKRTAYLPEKIAWPHEMSYLSVARAMFSGRHLETALETARAVSLDIRKPYGALSKGNAQKFSVALLTAAGADRKLICMDEPFSGLDAGARAALWRIIDGIAAGRHVLVSIHSGSISAAGWRALYAGQGRLVPVPEEHCEGGAAEAEALLSACSRFASVLRHD